MKKAIAGLLAAALIFAAVGVYWFDRPHPGTH